MFSKAYQIASEFTFPVVLSIRQVSGEVKSSIGTFIIVNRDGWIMTAAHLIEPLFTAEQNRINIEDVKQRQAEIMGRIDLNESKRRKELRNVRMNPEWISNYSYWWGKDGIIIREFKIFHTADLAIGRIVEFDSNSITRYPIIKNPEKMQIGTSLCKLGYPFHEISSSFDEGTGQFKLDLKGGFPRFPIEGIYTRNAIIGKMDDGITDIRFLETSSPGLRGQSGGPIFDVNGVIWAIQSRTINLSLGFSPTIIRNGKPIEENQFINIGLGVHAEVIVKFLKEHNIDFAISEN